MSWFEWKHSEGKRMVGKYFYFKCILMGKVLIEPTIQKCSKGAARPTCHNNTTTVLTSSWGHGTS